MALDLGYPGCNQGFLDSELGSSAALTELEKGLRSAKLGEQSEAIVKFPRLLERYPFPVLINTALLKLAEVFRQGSNFLKLCVLRVCQESERHLDKMTSVDELVRRIITVMNSNDPVARALTLRTLGALAVILHNKKQVHHKVRSSLDSKDSVELEAAIFAAERFSARSKTFSVDMCPKLLDMIKGYATPLPVKLKIVPIFEHMHHEAATATQVRTACLDLLTSYPDQDFVIVILQTLTALSRHTLIHIPDQVSLLLQYLHADPRRKVQDEVLSDLSVLAGEETSHLWTREHLGDLIDYVNSLEKDKLRVAAINVLIKIIETGGVYQVELGPGAPIINLCQTFSYSSQLPVAASSTQLLTQLAVNCYREGISTPELDILSEAAQAIESLCLMASSGASDAGPTSYSSNYLKKSFKCIILLCKTKPDSTGQFVDILGGMLMERFTDRSNMLPVCETLAGLAAMKQGVLSPLIPDICSLISTIVAEREVEFMQAREETLVEKNRPLVLLLTMLLQTLRGHSWSQEAEESFRSGVDLLDNWSQYRVARAATRYGEHRVAANLFGRLKELVWSESHHYWLQSLELFSRGEEVLASQDNRMLQEKLTQAMNIFQRGLTSLRAGSSTQQQLLFQQQFIKCRIQYLQVLSQLVSAATSLQTSPPPAIAAALALQSRDDLQRCGRVTGQLRAAVIHLQECGEMWASLAESSFDADLSSLAEVRLMEKAVNSLAMWIEIVCLKSSLQGSMYADTEIEFVPDIVEGHTPAVQLQSLINTFQAIASEFKSLSELSDARPISHLHTSCMTSCVRRINACPLPYPRFFYQSLQETRLKLSITPQPRASSEPVPVNTSQLLAIKVEGVIERSGVDHKQSRQVSQVLVQLQTSLQSSKTDRHMDNIKHHQDQYHSTGQTSGSTHLEQCAHLQNDFFSVDFLAPFAVAGLYTLTLEARLIDPDGNRWRTGVKHTLTVKSFEDRTNSGRTLTRN